MDSDKERIAEFLKLIQSTKIIKDDSIPCKIEEGLYLGSLGAATNRSALKSLNVTHILTVAYSLAPAYPNDFTYKLIQVHDKYDVTISQYFDDCFAFIEEARVAGGGVLVHCYAGRSRRWCISKGTGCGRTHTGCCTVTIVVAYLMYKNGMSFLEALEYVRAKRPTASPNFGFMFQLRMYGRSLQGKKIRSQQEVEKPGHSIAFN